MLDSLGQEYIFFCRIEENDHILKVLQIILVDKMVYCLSFKLSKICIRFKHQSYIYYLANSFRYKKGWTIYLSRSY